MRPLPTRDELYAALPHSLLLRQLAVRWADERPAYALGGAVAMYHAWDTDRNLVVVGDPADALTLTRAIRERDPDPGLVTSVPEDAGKHLVAEDGYAAYEGWAYRWTTGTPPIDDNAAQWLADGDAGEVADVLGRGFPDASMQVGDPAVRRWAGLRRNGRLVAVAADATAAGAPGFLASIASDPEVRGTGAGLAVTAWATAELLREQAACGLWHMAGNAPAATLYTRLGFRDDDRMMVAVPPE
ncbi:MAG TPA: GNAT family N-acetyltransferase [Frankiaceae bacterium]|nr:GNAT family N-acetyltransferase [Frankiaceae bacterium]